MNAPVKFVVRQATVNDLDECVAHAKAFHQYGPYAAFPMDDEAFRAFLASIIDNGVVFFHEGGIIAGLISPLYFNPSILMGAELFWWAPAGGRQLRTAFEAWARSQGAQGVQFSGLVNERFNASMSLFKRAGFHPTEVGYLKVF